jgi:hypothetical protein
MKEATYTQKGDDGLPLWSISTWGETQAEAETKLAEALIGLRGKGRNDADSPVTFKPGKTLGQYMSNAAPQTGAVAPSLKALVGNSGYGREA